MMEKNWFKESKTDFLILHLKSISDEKFLVNFMFMNLMLQKYNFCHENTKFSNICKGKRFAISETYCKSLNSLVFVT
jgi:hypothetical protein